MTTNVRRLVSRASFPTSREWGGDQSTIFEAGRFTTLVSRAEGVRAERGGRCENVEGTGAALWCSVWIGTRSGKSRSAIGFRAGSGNGMRSFAPSPKTTWIVQLGWMGHAGREDVFHASHLRWLPASTRRSPMRSRRRKGVNTYRSLSSATNDQDE
jgi:hypothetical protein